MEVSLAKFPLGEWDQRAEGPWRQRGEVPENLYASGPQNGSLGRLRGGRAWQRALRGTAGLHEGW